MIAPLRPPQTNVRRGGRQLHKAHDFVAATLFGNSRTGGDRTGGENGPPVSRLKAWAFALWTVAITAAYGTAMLGWW